MANICLNKVSYTGNHIENIISAFKTIEEDKLTQLTIKNQSNNSVELYFSTEDSPIIEIIRYYAVYFEGEWVYDWQETMMGDVGRIYIHPNMMEKRLNLTDAQMDEIEEDEEGFYIYKGETYELKGEIFDIMLNELNNNQ